MTPDLNSRAPIDIAALEALEKAAHEGSWKSHFDGAVYQTYARGERDIFRPGGWGTKEDADFVAALRNAAPELIKAAKERDVLRKCSVCGDATELGCSDCRIDFRTTIFVCCKPECLDEHERKCSVRVRAERDDLRALLNANEDSHRGAVATAASLRALLAEAGEAMVDVKTHADVWASLLKQARDASPPPTEDMDDRSYYQHELDVLAMICRVFASIQSALRDASPTMGKPE